jgi:hypothetical protein
MVGYPGPPRPFVAARLVIPAHQLAGNVDFLIDTGADSTVLAPRDALRLGLDLSLLPQGPGSAGVGGTTPTVQVDAIITLDQRSFTTTLRILAPSSQRQMAALAWIPSLLGRDLLAHFALFFEERTGKVLLLESAEADALGLR